ncbi:probable disease resistance RPP8-like protein 2 [Phoenix dactylifera]|uniref:Probable disease resistance RPP8-like protein 2 n=1 Tax=Phoenix dactylifera TaxID=42345 RepID=A0A8B9A3K1_PHODC|nr:probable disease resistance RPP8-like protein 2 [Phoenix dactylifera]
MGGFPTTFAWVSVSQSYRGIELVKDIMEKVMRIKKKKEDLEQMGEKERNASILPNGNNGSRILLTTRNIEVARHAEPWIPPHELHLLDDTESWNLFRRKAFPPKQDVPTDLEALAQKLAKKCGGLPLALVVLGALLSKEDRSYHEWSRVAQTCHQILGLSYNDLPSRLKPCFLYIAAFPADSIISVSKLVRLWVAEGFMLQEKRQTMEDTAWDWLDELVQRCMIQVVRRSKARGRVSHIRIHDLLRDFGLEEAKKDEFLQVCSSDNMAVSDSISSHRAAFYRINEEAVVFSRQLRNLLGFSLILTNEGRFLNGLNLLRVLDLEGARDLEELPKQIGSMIHLQYLGLRGTGLTRLPSSIRHLLNLQTMDVRETQILWIPKSFWKIRTLRHVYININMFLSAPISGDHKNLQTLQIEKFEFGLDAMDMVRLLGIRFIKKWVTTPGFTREAIYKACCRTYGESLRKALEKMGSLLSLNLKFSPIPGDVLFARAPNLHQLRSLKLDGKLVLEQQEQLPDCSQFLPNLTKLKLSITQLKQDPMPVLEKLPSLSFLEVEINAFVGKSMLCSAGGFPRLQHLILESLPNLEEWRVEAGAMPSLTHLTIWNCKKLKMLPEGLQHVTTLRELKLNLMPREFNDRVRCKVRHIPSIIFEDE